MSAAEITVERLRLRSQRAVPGLLPSVEDALRVSSKPAALLNRFVLVRRLRLRAAAGASVQTLALQLERAWAQLAARAQPMDQAGDAAEAVWAPSLAVARQMLLKRWLRGEATAAWFWQRIAPPPLDAAWPARAVALMLRADDDEAIAVAATVGLQRRAVQVRALLEVIAQERRAPAFIAAIDDPQALALLGVTAAGPEPFEWAPPLLDAQGPGPRAATPRARLLESMTRLASGLEASPARRLAAPPGLSVTAPLPSSTTVPAPRAAARASPQDRAASATAARATRPLSVQEAEAGLQQGLASPWSGLWLLLPMLLRHGLDDADDPLAAWAGAMRAACRRLPIPADDALHTALAGLDLPPVDDTLWLRTARLAAVHDARLPLLRIARRRGAAWVSAERIDVEFPATSVDLRIRRAGFDLNPGFVPWLGRVVHFHYSS